MMKTNKRTKKWATSLAMACLALALSIGSSEAQSVGDPTKGKRVFNKCKSCHMVGEGAKNRAGPALNGIIDHPAGTAEKYRYSKAMTAAAAEGLVWTEANLAAYLRAPRKFLPKGKMAFAGLKKDDDITNLIAFLSTFEP